MTTRNESNLDVIPLPSHKTDHREDRAGDVVPHQASGSTNVTEYRSAGEGKPEGIAVDLLEVSSRSQRVVFTVQVSEKVASSQVVTRANNPVSRLIDSLLEKAARFEQSGDWQGAIETYEDIVQTDPSHTDAEVLLARSIRKRNQLLPFAIRSETVMPRVARHHANILNQALLEAVRRPNLNRIKALLAIGADCCSEDGFGNTALGLAADLEKPLILNELLQYSKPGQPEIEMIKAASLGKADSVRMWIESGTDLEARDEMGRTVLEVGCSKRPLQGRGYPSTRGSQADLR